MKNSLATFGILLLAVFIGFNISFLMFHVPQQKFLIIIIAALLFYPIFRFPILGVHLVFIIMPFLPFIRRLYYLMYKRPGQDPLLILGDIILVVILLSLFFEFKELREKSRSVTFFVTLIFMYFGMVLLRTFAANDQTATKAMMSFKFYGPAVLYFFVGAIFAVRQGHIKALWLTTIIIGCIAASYGFKQLFFGYSQSEKIWFASVDFTTLFIKGVPRPFSLFQAPVAFADYLQLAMIGVLMVTAWSTRKISYVLLLLLPFFFYGILTTSVRSSWLGAIIVLVLWVIFSTATNNRTRIWLILTLVLAYVVSTVAGDLMGNAFDLQTVLSTQGGASQADQSFQLLVADRASALSNPLQEHSLLSRINLWREILVLSLIPSYGLLGRGIGALNADSLYMTYLAELGYPGLAFILFILGAFIYKGFVALETLQNRFALALARGILVMDLTMVIVCITGTHMHYFPGDIYFWFFNGVLIRIDALETSDTALQST